MADSQDSRKKMAEVLWAEINRALLQSPDIRATVKNLRDLNLLEIVKEFNLVLDVEKLVNEILKDGLDAGSVPPYGVFGTKADFEENRKPPENWGKLEMSQLKFLAKKKALAPSSRIKAQRIDGRALSPNEISFQEYLNDQFDELTWMKQVGVRFVEGG